LDRIVLVRMLYAPDLQGSGAEHPGTFILCHIRRRGALLVWDSFLLRLLDRVSVCLLAKGGCPSVCVTAMNYIAFGLHFHIFTTADVFFLRIFRLFVEVRLIGLVVEDGLVTAEAVVSPNANEDAAILWAYLIPASSSPP
jgi:hypothetical protein